MRRQLAINMKLCC